MPMMILIQYDISSNRHTWYIFLNPLMSYCGRIHNNVGKFYVTNLWSLHPSMKCCTCGPCCNLSIHWAGKIIIFIKETCYSISITNIIYQKTPKYHRLVSSPRKKNSTNLRAALPFVKPPPKPPLCMWWRSAAHANNPGSLSEIQFIAPRDVLLKTACWGSPSFGFKNVFFPSASSIVLCFFFASKFSVWFFRGFFCLEASWKVSLMPNLAP